MAWKPTTPFNILMILLTPTYSKIKGVPTKSFPNPADIPEDYLFYGSFRTFGGTENFSNDVYTIIDTATINTWYHPDITADCRIYIPDTNQTYEVLGSPENINMRNQYLQFKVRKVGGKP